MDVRSLTGAEAFGPMNLTLLAEPWSLSATGLQLLGPHSSTAVSAVPSVADWGCFSSLIRSPHIHPMHRPAVQCLPQKELIRALILIILKTFHVNVLVSCCHSGWKTAPWCKKRISFYCFYSIQIIQACKTAKQELPALPLRVLVQTKVLHQARKIHQLLSCLTLNIWKKPGYGQTSDLFSLWLPGDPLEKPPAQRDFGRLLQDGCWNRLHPAGYVATLWDRRACLRP